MDEEKGKLVVNMSRHKIDYVKIIKENSQVKYTPGKWQAIRLYVESSLNMIVLMCNYVAQSALTDMMGAITSNKKLNKHMVKVYSRDAYEEINKSIEKCIVGKRDADQTDYLFVYTDFMDEHMRPRVQEIKRLTEETLTERGCKMPSMCAWVLTTEGLTRMACNVFLGVMGEIKDIFKCDFTADFQVYFLDKSYDNIRKLVFELERKFPEIGNLDVVTNEKTAKIFNDIDDEIRNATVLEKASDEADEALTEEHLKYKDTTVRNIMSFVADDLEEYQRKYAAGEI